MAGMIEESRTAAGRKLVAAGVVVGSTQTGVAIVECFTCGWTHPVTRRHCEVCGSASLFSHEVHSRRSS